MSSLEQLRARLADVNALHAAMAIMDWDQQTYMPKGGAEARAEHQGILSRMAHESFTDGSTVSMLEKATGDVESEDDQALIRVVRRDLDLATKLPTSLVEEKSKLSAIAHERWVEARANNDFATFAPTLARMFELAHQEAECLGYKDHIYDALLDQYEEGSTAADVRAMFTALKGPQVEMVKAIGEQPPIDDSFLYGDWNLGTQKEFTQGLVAAIGFDFSRGRQDVAPHPFCTGWSVGDVRLTTRFQKNLAGAISNSMHEAGHGVYEQGSPAKWDRTPLAGGVSLGVHESQSRLWEKIVGQSRSFWSHFLPGLKRAYPVLAPVDLDSFYRAINKVQPSLIRVDADELTYNLHVLVRFELECDILEGKLAVRDLPQAWNAKYQEYLGITPPNDSNGCLQDVHWSMGSIGYFPTYSMGNVLSYQIWNALKRAIPDADALMEQGKFESILGWLQENIYLKGRSLKPKELILQATGKPMDPTDYLEGLHAKYSAIYRL